MKRIGDGVGLAAGVKVSNIWLFTDALDRKFLIDCGHVLERSALKRALWKGGIRRPGDLDGVILTHRHSDHAGNAYWLKRTYDAPVFCHADDAPYLTGEKEAPPLTTSDTPLWARPICRLEDRYPARSPVDDVFEEGAWQWDFEIAHSPGHTEGSCMLFHPPTRTLFSGDVILAGAATIRMVERMRFADPAFSYDVDMCRAYVEAFVRRLPGTNRLLSGHGPAITKDADEKLKRLMERR